MAISVPKSPEGFKSFLSNLDRILMEKAMEWARKSYAAIAEDLDEALADNRSEDLSIEHRRGVWYRTCLGVVRVRRRQYRDGDGRCHCLLDEVMGMGKYRHTTVKVEETATELASTIPYRRSADLLRKVSAMDIPHQTIWRLVAKVADPHLAETDRKQKWLLETGEIPEGERQQVGRLFVEADGVMLSLQRQQAKKAEVKLGIAYEGWKRVGKDRYQTTNKTAFATVGGEQSFWAGMTLKLHEKYDLARVKETIVGGDGARWVRDGAHYVDGRFQLDGYHLNRELTTALGRDSETKGKVWHACQCGDVKMGLSLLGEAMRRAHGDQAQKLAKTYNYVRENSDGIVDYRFMAGTDEVGLRRTGAIEGNVDKLVARRMKNQGMSWTVKGIRRLLCIRLLVLEGKLTGWVRRRAEPEITPPLPGRKVRRIVRRALSQDAGEWLQVQLPALHGPHAARPWVQTLKAISQASAI